MHHHFSLSFFPSQFRVAIPGHTTPPAWPPSLWLGIKWHLFSQKPSRTFPRLQIPSSLSHVTPTCEIPALSGAQCEFHHPQALCNFENNSQDYLRKYPNSCISRTMDAISWVTSEMYKKRKKTPSTARGEISLYLRNQTSRKQLFSWF